MSTVSTVSTAVDETDAAPAANPVLGPGEAGPAGTAAVMALRDRVQVLHLAVDAVRAVDGDGATPATAAAVRDATGRLAALLGSFAAIVDGAATGGLRRSLEALTGRAAALVEADGARVLGERMLADVPRALVVGPVPDRLRHHQRDRARAAAGALAAALDEPRTASTLADAGRLVITPPLTEAARGKTKVLARCVAADDDRLDETVEGVLADPASTAQAWEPLRAAALALSSSASAVAAEHGKKARRLASVADDVVGAVDELTEAVRLQRLLVDLADVAHRHREPGFTYGVLHSAARAHEDAARARLADAVDALSREKLHSWLPGR